MMKKILLISLLTAYTFCGWSQEASPQSKYGVVTNAFWSNLFVQADASWSPRNHFGGSLALGKWFTPGIGARVKMTGGKYWMFGAQTLFNFTHLFKGYNEKRRWDIVPYLGISMARAMKANRNAVGATFGLLNQVRVARRWAVNVDASYAIYANSLPKNKIFTLEVGLTYYIGKTKWNKGTDAESVNEMNQMEIDALNAQLEDLKMENESLRQQLEEKSEKNQK